MQRTKLSLVVGSLFLLPTLPAFSQQTASDDTPKSGDTAVQTVTVQGRPGLRVPPGGKSQRQIDSLRPGAYKVTLEGAPFEATVRAEE